MLFSQRYHRAIEKNVLVVEIPDTARRKLWAWLSANNSSFIVRRDPNNSWTSNSSVLEETERELLVEHGWEHLQTSLDPSDTDCDTTLRGLVLEGPGPFVFDTIEIAVNFMDAGEREALRQKVNQIFELHGCPWRISDGEFFKLDVDFVGARLAATAHDALAANQFAGATNEYAKARQYLGTGDVREAIFFAGHSFESVMKVLTKLEHANGDKLIKELGAQGLFDDLPESVRNGFMDQVLKALPFLRNKLGGHGQGVAVVDIPPVYGALAIQIAAAFQNFLITKHLGKSPLTAKPQPAEKISSPSDDDIPF
jgi:hypothetical protein